jgi:hypothetical protein
MCKDTPFSELVDIDGCSKSQKPTISYGELILKVGRDIFIDKSYKNIDSLNFYIDYKYSSWDISISNSHSTTDNTYNKNSSYSSDIYLSIGESLNFKENIFKLSLGTKFDKDYFLSLNYNYLLSDKQNIFLYYEYNTKREASFAIGDGYLITENWYSALSYNHISSFCKKLESIDLFNSYKFTKNIFGTFGYAYALDSLSYQNILSFSIGFTF